MANSATKNEVQDVVSTTVTKAVDDLSEIIQSFAQNVDERFDRLEKRVDKLEVQFDRLNNTLNAFLKRLDDVEIDNHARDAQLARLERWIEQVATKTGVKLEY
jgi:tetrahydromethanopterin S-methyltransferase subunit B